MLSSIYRFRSTSALLDRFHELENQEIYFASASELNDQLEAFKDLFWRGDVIVWTNLLRHYLLCLTHVILRALEDPQCELTPDTMPSSTIPEDLAPESRRIFDQLCMRFFADEELSELPALLAGRQAPIRRNELLSLLWPLHFRVLPLVFTTISPERPVHPIDAGFRRRTQHSLRLKESFAALNQMDISRPDSADILEIMTSKIVSQVMQAIFIQDLIGANQSRGVAWNVISSSFPELYLNALEKLLYYDWYTASFVAEPTQAAMWGYYGDSYRGACLKFKTSILSDGKAALTLNCMIGVSGDQKSSSPRYEFRPLELHEIQYRDRYTEIDFFASLGRLTRQQLRFWFLGTNGALSSTGRGMLQESEEWRQNYWESFHGAVTTKLKGWQHEREYRVALHSMIADLSDRTNRKLRYRFDDLQAIIFGIKTSNEDKRAIVHLIQEKCKLAGRRDFEFHQTYYSRRTGTVAGT